MKNSVDLHTRNKLQRIVIVVNEIRISKNISQRKLAEKTGLHYTTIAFIESGKRDCYNLTQLLRIAEALRVPLSEILQQAKL